MADSIRLFASSWGGVPLWLSNIETDAGRDLIVQKYARGSNADVQNAGGVPRTSRVTILFDEIRGQTEDADTRRQKLEDLKDTGKPQIFVHPIYGSYRAEIGEYQLKIDENGTVSASASFVPTEDPDPDLIDPVGVSIDGGTANIAARVADLDAELLNVDLDDQSVASAVATTAASVFDGVPAYLDGSIGDALAPLAGIRDVLVQLGRVSTTIDQEIDDLKLDADVELWPLFKAYVMLADAAFSGASAALGDDGGLFTMIVNAPTSLRRLCVDLYGEDFDLGYYRALDLNPIPRPYRIDAGTKLRLVQPRAL